MSRAEPRFDLDLTYGKAGEALVGTFIEWIATGSGKVEVKRKRILDLQFYIETHCDKGRKGHFAESGILVTTAEAWVFVIGDTNISVIVPTTVLRQMLDHVTSRDKEAEIGNCPTKGKLIDLNTMLYVIKKSRLNPTPKLSADSVVVRSEPLRDQEVIASNIRW